MSHLFCPRQGDQSYTSTLATITVVSEATAPPEVVTLLTDRPDAEAPAERARAARIAAPTLDPDVAAVLSGLEALDRRDQLIRLCARLYAARERNEPDELIHAALFELEEGLNGPLDYGD
ncbi:MAG: hypothetical protein IPN01_32345 [Deltaproteobacteria bacterium]|nr:hypothetical protein [Deltaproteobacteria bacterium]